jgi:signal transduction histidine kinase
MVTGVTEPDQAQGSTELVCQLEQTLEALLEFTGATAGWVGLPSPEGRLEFPARRGTFPEAWLALQQGQVPVWGFEVREGPTLLNDLPALPALGEPPLRNLLSCPVLRDEEPAGQVVLANKPPGFTSHDAIVLQAVAHLLRKRLAQPPAAPRSRVGTSVLQRALDHVSEGVLVVDQAGTLLFANATWAQWTGFRPEELANHPAPFPFWVSHRELSAVGPRLSALGPTETPPRPSSRSLASAGRRPVLPFRHRNDTVFWCQVEIVRAEIDSQAVTLAFLRRLPAVGGAGHGLVPVGGTAGDAISFQALAETLPFAVALVDRHGQVLWVNSAFAQQVPPGAALLGHPLRSVLTTVSAATLEQLIRNPRSAEPGRRGSLLLQRANREGVTHDLVAHWLSVSLASGPGFLLALADNWEGLWPPNDAVAQHARAASRPAVDWLALRFRPGGTIDFWDEQWVRLTGLTPQDLAGVPAELVLDWLFPHQRDREFVADLLHQPDRRGTQAMLELASPTGSQPLLCTFLPLGRQGDLARAVSSTESAALRPTGSEDWLLLVCEPEPVAGEDSAAQRFLRQFARGLSHLLNNYLCVPVGLAEMALDRGDLPAEVAGWFDQILDNCMRANQLIASLQDLAAVTPGELQLLPLAALVREFLEEYAAENPPRTYELTVDVQAPDAMVQVNPRLLKVVLRHLVTNAEQALLNRLRRRLDVRVLAVEGKVGCEIQDTGEGLPTADWTAVLAPFYSTKGPFAREGEQAALDATGLGLTVSQHLLALHGGRLELRSTPGEGTTARFFLPRAEAVRAGSETIRADAPAEVAGPHPLGGQPPGVSRQLSAPPDR